MIVLIIFALLIAIGILLIKYFKAYARLKSHTAFNSAATRQMEDLKKKDSNITCDYCGAKFDYKTHTICPQCGAAYNKDKEWTTRFDYNQDFVDSQADAFVSQEISKAQQEAAATLKKIRKALIILGTIIGGILLIFIVSLLWREEEQFAKDDELNQYASDDFVKALYQIKDGVIYDDEKVKIEVTGLYSDRDSSSSMKEIEYHLINNSDENLRIKVQCIVINGYADPDYYEYAYELVKAGDDITKYARVYKPDMIDNIESMIWGNVEIYSENYEYEANAQEYVKVTTDAEKETEPFVGDETVIYENDYVRIYACPQEEQDENSARKEVKISVENKTEYNFNVEARKGRMSDGKEIEIGGLYRACLPGKCFFKDIDLYSYDDIEQETFENNMEVNFTFACSEYPEIGFSTGYVKVTEQ